MLRPAVVAFATSLGRMAEHQGEEPSRPLPQFAAAAVLPIAALTALAHCGAALLGRGYWFDEVYMLAIGRFHLDWGSADQPPVTPALAALADGLAPGAQLVLRAPAILATAAAVVLAGLIARELGGGRGAQALTALAQATALWPSLTGHWLTPYSLEPAQWLLLVWLLMRWVRTRRDRVLIAAGIVVGVAAMTKFQVVLLSLVMLASIAMFGPRAMLCRPALWLGAVIAVFIAAPTVWWQHTHGWPQLQMTEVLAGEAGALYGGRPGIAVQLILYAGVLGVVLMGYGAWRLLRDTTMRDYRFILATGVVLFVAFIALQGRPYYLAGLYAPFAAAGALGLQTRWARGPGRGRRWLHAACVVSVIAAVAMLVLSVQINRSDIGERIARDTAQVFRGLPPAQREHTALLGESYIVAAYLDGYASQYGLPSAYSPNRSYGYFTPPPDTAETVLFIGKDPAALREYFTSEHTVGKVGDDMRIHLLTGRGQPWSVIWPRLRTLTVS